MEIIGLDHIYLTVSDLQASEIFYDPVMKALNFKKGVMPIGEEPHFHYFNQNLQISIRPAHTDGRFDPYAPGLHHICLQVGSRLEVEESARVLKRIGVETSLPAFFPEYAEDYYAIFFNDPDGIRFEIVSRREDRRFIATHWSMLEGFVNPIRRLKARLKYEGH
jgi:catechol 2,3-dioxygenase-like lactoylglutathione lyase family enzyme